MEAILLIGLPASGKSSYYQGHFFNSHLRLSLDLLRTRHREQQLLLSSIKTQTKVCIDNTNASRAERARYLEPLKQAGYTLTGYYFQSIVSDCLARNALRKGKARIPDAGVLGTATRLELPDYSEGFSKLYYVRLDSGSDKHLFITEDWQHDL